MILRPRWLLLLLWVLAVALALTGLGELPLRDWDEGTVARVALETPWLSGPEPLLPRLWGEPYLNKPPGIHLGIAAAIGLWRLLGGAAPGALPPEGVVRLVPALLSTAAVPLVGLVLLRLRPREPWVAVAGSAILLTLLPLARHGRLAMLDGTLLSAMLLLWWAVLEPAPGRAAAARGGAVAGLAGSLLLLLKAPAALPLLVGVLVLRALDRDLGPEGWRWLGFGLLVGLLPGLAWHGWHLAVRGPDALQMWGHQGFARVAMAIEGHGGGPLPPLIEVLEGGWPWLPLWPFGMALAWRQRGQRCGRWCLGLTLLTALLVLPLRTQLPWYALLLWPAFALVCAPVLVGIVRRPPAASVPAGTLLRRVPLLWAVLGLLLLGAAGLAGSGAGTLPRGLAPVLLAGGTALAVGGAALASNRERRRRLGVVALVGGFWLALVLLMASPLWLWELNEEWAVAPVAALVRRAGSEPVELWRMEPRPSLDWYAGRRIRRFHPDRGGEAGESSGLWLLARRLPDAGARRCIAAGEAPPLTLYQCSTTGR